MARVTVEDCVEKVPNRFDLVMLAGHRSRNITAGAPLTVERDNDKNPVVALREIADGTVGVEETYESLVRSMQRHVEIDEPEEEDALELMAGAMMASEEINPAHFIRETAPAAEDVFGDVPSDQVVAEDVSEDVLSDEPLAGDIIEAAPSDEPEAPKTDTET